ncbi:MAG: hypothetical protein QOJ90_1287 [Actinomycetota bacterium]|nr:hypothetical protein [Actinomycetota bacterium]
MSGAIATGATTDPHAADLGRGSLLLAEVHRITARRFIRWLLAVSLVTYLVIVSIVGLTQFAKPSAAGLAHARHRVQAAVANQKAARDQCLKDPNRPTDQPAEQICGPDPAAGMFRVQDFVDPPAFDLQRDLPATAIAVGVATAALAFLIGATYVGAEWSSRSMVALLFWEPRRLRVMSVKLGVLAAAAALLGVLGQLIWLATAEILQSTRGAPTHLPAHFWSDLVAQEGRTILFVVLMGLLGFGIANLIRNTGASMGVGFVYFAIVENAVRVARPRWQEWLLTDNIAGLLSKGGYRLPVDSAAVSPGGGVVPGQPHEIFISNLHGGLVLGGVTAAIVAAGVASFVRRDLH